MEDLLALSVIFIASASLSLGNELVPQQETPAIDFIEPEYNGADDFAFALEQIVRKNIKWSDVEFVGDIMLVRIKVPFDIEEMERNLHGLGVVASIDRMWWKAMCSDFPLDTRIIDYLKDGRTILVEYWDKSGPAEGALLIDHQFCLRGNSLRH